MNTNLSNENKKNTFFLYLFTLMFLFSGLSKHVDMKFSSENIAYAAIIGVLGMIILAFRFELKEPCEFKTIAIHLHICSAITSVSLYLYSEYMITFIVFFSFIVVLNWLLFLIEKGSKANLSLEDYKLLKKNLFPAMFIPLTGLIAVSNMYKNNLMDKKIVFAIFLFIILFSIFISYKECKNIIKNKKNYH